MSEEFSVFEELMNTMHSHYVQTMQKEMQKVLKKVHEMPTESWRERAISIVGNVVFELMMMDTKPNYCIVMNNSVDQTVYVSRYPSVSASNFEFKVSPGTRMQWLWGRGIDRLYFFAAGNANVFVQSYVSDFNPAAVNMLQTQSQIIANTVASPVPTSIVGSLAKSPKAVTPADNTPFAGGLTIGLYVGGTGNVVVLNDDGTKTTYTALSGGMIHPIQAKGIDATGTTATNILAVY